MSLLADLAAVDFGYFTVGECLQRIGNTLAGMEKLERYRGHFFNWYDTRTLQPLHPQYVSSVDSGNLAGSLLVLQAGLAELKNQPVLSSIALQGLQDTLHATKADAQIFGRLANSVIYGNAPRRAAPGIIARNQLGQSGLWRFAISGDLPIVLLLIGDVNRIDLVKQVVQAHAYWRMKGLAADLVIVNEGFSGNRAMLQDLIIGLINAGPEA